MDFCPCTRTWERELVAGKRGATRLGFSPLLRFYVRRRFAEGNGTPRAY